MTSEDIPFAVGVELPPPLTDEELLLLGEDDPEVGPKPDPLPLDESSLGELRIVTLDEFADVDELGAAAILGTSDDALIPEGADVMTYGDGGVGKTSLMLDLAFNLAAGDDWLGIAVPRPLRVLVIENEGPRALFRRKLKRKRDAWTGSPLGDRLQVFEEPWGQFSFADADSRRRIAEAIREREVDVVIVGPLTASGMNLPGTLRECREFLALVAEVRAASGRRFANLLVHHENRGGNVSGAWEGAGDTLLHVTAQGRGSLRLFVQKARWSSEQHGTTLKLAWADGEGFTVEEKPELDDDAIAEMIVAEVAADPGLAWSRVVERTKGVGDRRRRAVRDQLLRAERIVNVAKDEAGELVALDHCPERKKAKLYPADDPTIRHLRPDLAAEGPQTAAAGGERVTADLRPAARPIRAAGRRPQSFTPSLDLGDDSRRADENEPDEDEIERLAERARAAQRVDQDDGAEGGEAER